MYLHILYIGERESVRESSVAISVLRGAPQLDTGYVLCASAIVVAGIPVLYDCT